MIISTNPSIIIKLRGKMTAFHDALLYLASLTEIKSTSRSRLHVFFVVVKQPEKFNKISKNDSFQGCASFNRLQISRYQDLNRKKLKMQEFSCKTLNTQNRGNWIFTKITLKSYDQNGRWFWEIMTKMFYISWD